MDRDPLPPKESGQELPEDYLFALRRRLHEAAGDMPGALEIRAHAMCEALGIPTGAHSVITKREGGRTSEDIERDRIIGEYLSNKSGVVIDEKRGVTSRDFRDLYPDALPAQLSTVLDPRTRTIMEIEYRHRASVIGNSQSRLFANDAPIEYHRLSGGVDLFLRGYIHDEEWQRRHGEFLKEADVNAAVLCIEGFMDRPLGASLSTRYHDSNAKDYGTLMREAVDAGFTGIFTEVDARDTSRIRMDSQVSARGLGGKFPDLPPSFFDTYRKYLDREHPQLARAIERSGGLQRVLRAQAHAIESSDDYYDRAMSVSKKGITYSTFPRITEKGSYSLEPTYLELGQHMFADALAAIKLHLIARLMERGLIPSGPIIDYQGAAHTMNKGFFLKYPEYATEVVLRAVNELMAGKAWRLHAFFRGARSVYRHFNTPNWETILREIARVPIGRVEAGHMRVEELDVLKILGISLKHALPSEKDIARIQKIARGGSA